MKERELRRQKITIDIGFKFLKIKIDWEARSWKWLPQAKSTWKETASIEITVTSISTVRWGDLAANLVLRLNS